MTTINEIYLRLKAKTPKFFKKLQRVFIAVGVFGASLAAYNQFMVGWIPEWTLPTCFIISALGSFMSQLTVEDKSEIGK